MLNRVAACLIVSGLAFGICPVVCAQQPAAPDAESFLNLQEILARAKRQVFPALVFVKPIVEDYDSGEKQKRQVFGSGVIISEDGKVLTNNHVVDKAVRVHCVLYDKDQVKAEILGRDPDTDLALLQLDVGDEKKPLPYAEFADSDQVHEGDFVMALGSPFGFTRSISLGIISNTQRYLGFESEYRYNTWIQTDAAINPGNSGGPLVDTQGRVVGINTLGIFLADNVGFSIPSNVAKQVAAGLAEDGEMQRSWSGMKLQPLRDFFTDTFTDAESGVLLAGVERDSPADVAGMRKGDILLSMGGEAFNGTFAEDLPAIEWAIAEMASDVPLSAVVLRGGEQLKLEIVLTGKGEVEGETLECRRWNMTVKEINKYKEPELYFYREQGVFVHAVRHPGNAEKADIKRGDILTVIDGRPVESLAEIEDLYEAIVADEDRDKTVLVEVLRNGYKKWLNLDYKTDYDKED